MSSRIVFSLVLLAACASVPQEGRTYRIMKGKYEPRSLEDLAEARCSKGNLLVGERRTSYVAVPNDSPREVLDFTCVKNAAADPMSPAARRAAYAAILQFTKEMGVTLSMIHLENAPHDWTQDAAEANDVGGTAWQGTSGYSCPRTLRLLRQNVLTSDGNSPIQSEEPLWKQRGNKLVLSYLEPNGSRVRVGLGTLTSPNTMRIQVLDDGMHTVADRYLTSHDVCWCSRVGV